MQILSYLFYPNPGNADYTSPKALVLLVVCGLLVLAALTLRQWRKSSKNPVTKRLSRSWPTAAFWFGFIGLVLVASRAEEISYVSMRFWWVVWLGALLFYLWLQVRLWRARHYEPLPGMKVDDPREKYLPKKKR